MASNIPPHPHPFLSLWNNQLPAPLHRGAPRLCLPVHFRHTRNPTHVAPPHREARPMIGCHLLSAHQTAVWMSKEAGECQNYGIGNSHKYTKPRGAMKSWVCSGSKSILSFILSRAYEWWRKKGSTHYHYKAKWSERHTSCGCFCFKREFTPNK